MLSSIKTKLTITAICFSLVLSSVLVHFVVLEQDNVYQDTLSQYIKALSKNISEEMVDAFASKAKLVEITSILLQFDEHETIVAAFVFDNSGNLIQPYLGPAGKTRLDELTLLQTLASQAPSGSSVDYGLFIHKETIGSGSLDIAKLVVLSDAETAISAARKHFLTRAVPIGAVVVLIVGFVFTALLRNQFSPIIKLTHFTEKVTRNRRYTAKFNTRGNNEISRLGDSINLMIQTIHDELDRNIRKTNQLSKQQAVMEKLANFDSLTGLPNRQYIMEYLRTELARAKREESDFSVLFFDLDGFKAVNDTLGHDAGDSVLRAVAIRLKDQLREGDSLARLGGDEFLLIPHQSRFNQNSIESLANKIIAAMLLPFHENGLDLHIGVSIGIANASQAGYELSELISFADIAMYESKRAGKSQLTAFRPAMIDELRRKLSIGNSIPGAIVNNEFRLVYQAKMDKDKRVVGFEALLRWHNSDLGWVSPAEFIPLAEQGGKIHDVTRWVITNAFKAIPSLVNLFGSHLKVSLNLSAIDLLNPNLIAIIEEQRMRSDVNTSNIEFEVTESAYLENFRETDRFFNRLNQLGYQVALDDFGTGFSSLSYLAQIQIHTLKIDKRFVHQIEHNPKAILITNTIIDLAKRLDLTVCAEGIETESQFTRLCAEGCHTFQGFLFSKPLELSDIPALLDQQQRKHNSVL